jgi:hypothetical protein
MAMEVAAAAKKGAEDGITKTHKTRKDFNSTTDGREWTLVNAFALLMLDNAGPPAGTPEGKVRQLANLIPARRTLMEVRIQERRPWTSLRASSSGLLRG